MPAHTQNERRNSAFNTWEADPWNAGDELADRQLAGFTLRAEKPVAWRKVHDSNKHVFGIAIGELRDAEAGYYAFVDGENLLLIQRMWHGWPDPPEWQLITISGTRKKKVWTSWGSFALLPAAWQIPSDYRES